MEINASSAYAGAVGDVVVGDETSTEMQMEDYFQMLISELTQQDPFEPTSNETLLNQISTIQSMQESTELTNTLEELVSSTENTQAVNLLLTQTLESMSIQSNMSTGASLIGKEVTASVAEDGSSERVEITGVVKGVKMVDGDVKLELTSGSEVSMMDVLYVATPTETSTETEA